VLQDTSMAETHRLLLRPWREEDGVELQRLFNDPAVRGGRNLPPDRIARLAEGSLQQWRVNGFGPWAAIDKTTGSWIGMVGLNELDDWPGVDKIEVGFELHKAWWGRGLATEGARAALAFGFEQHGLQCIHQCHGCRACRRSPGHGESGAHVQRHTLLDESRSSGCVVCHRPCRMESEQVGSEHAVTTFLRRSRLGGSPRASGRRGEPGRGGRHEYTGIH
jgi:RimJ/RimL family protein N-acetyltransferase